MLIQLTTVASRNHINPPNIPDIKKAVGRVTIPGPSVLMRRLMVVDLTPPGLTNFFDFLESSFWFKF